MAAVFPSLARPFLVLATGLGGIWAATQWTAAMLGYAPQLGPAWFGLFGWPVYRPWQVFAWWLAYGSYLPQVFERAAAALLVCLLLQAAAALLCNPGQRRQARDGAATASARWASKAEIARAGLLNPAAGLLLGQFGGRYLRHDGPGHVIALSPTRSGKGAGLVVPTLLSWTGSALIYDIKGENWHLTAGWRSRFSRCLLFNPADPCSARYNPLLEVRKGPDEVRDAQNIADILVDPDGALQRRNHWQNTSHDLLVGVILHVLYAEPDKTLSRVAGLLSDPERPFEQTLRRMMATNHLGSAAAPRAHPVVAAVARALLDKSDNERSGIHSTALSFLSLFRDPIVAEVTSACDFRVADLIDAPHPLSLYLVVPPSDLSRTRALIRLVLNQIDRRLTERLAGMPGGPDAGAAAGDRRRRLLLMLDEFPTLGRLDFLETSLSYIAGYGIRAFLIAQSPNQIARIYGERHSIIANCDIRIVASCNEYAIAREISDSLGLAIEQQARHSYSGRRAALWLPHVSVSRQETARPLLSAREIMQLARSEEIVLAAGLPPIRARKLRYFCDRNFTARRLPPPPPRGLGGLADGAAALAADWAGHVRSPDPRLLPAAADAVAEALPQPAPGPLPLFDPLSCRTASPPGEELCDDMAILADDIEQLAAVRRPRPAAAGRSQASDG